MTNLTFFAHSPHIRGAERMLLNLAVLLQQNNQFHVNVAIPNIQSFDLNIKNYLIQEGITLIEYPSSSWFIYQSRHSDDFRNYSVSLSDSINEIKNILIESNTDVVLVNTLTNIAPLISAYEINLPIVNWIHGILDDFLIHIEDFQYKLLCEKIFLSLGQKNVFCSKWTQNYFQIFLDNPNSSCQVIPNFSINPICDIPKVSFQSNVQFTCLNSFESNKGHTTLLNAIKKLKNLTQNFHVSLYGDGLEKDNIVRLINDLELTDFISVHSHTNDVLEVYKSSHCLLQPSYIESFGMTIIEAMSFGLPVISAKSGGPEDIIIDGFNGFLYDKTDDSDLCSKMLSLITSFDLLCTMGENASKVFHEKFDGKNAVEKFSSIFEEINVNFKGYSKNQQLLVDSFLLLHDVTNVQNITNIHTIEHQNSTYNKKIFPIVDTTSLKLAWLHKKSKFDLHVDNKNRISKIYFIPATNFKKFHTGVLICNIYNKSYPLFKIRETSINLNQIDDNEWLLFEFDPIDLTSSIQLQVEFQIIQSNEKLAVYVNKDLTLFACLN